MKLFTILFSTFCLLSSAAVATPSMEIVRELQLDTAEGRLNFLTEHLAPFAAKADLLNQEIQALAEEIKALSPQDQKSQITGLTEDMTQKMDTLIAMMPVLNLALSADEDLQQIDGILQQEEPLTAEQQQVLDRLASLCGSLGNL